MRYQIISSSNSPELEYYVCAYLEDGWTLAGGVSVCYNPRTENVTYVQAITKDSK